MKTRVLHSEQEMIKFGEEVAVRILAPAVIELVGDVGTGKTTITRGLARGLGIAEPVTSPSFTISKEYAFQKDGRACTLVHYDFYRLPDPGIMADDLLENIEDQNTIVVVEWADSVQNILPEDRLRFNIILQDDGSRRVEEA